jgi:hypothetical protein
MVTFSFEFQIYFSAESHFFVEWDVKYLEYELNPNFPGSILLNRIY